jgi:hypothetical protein
MPVDLASMTMRQIGRALLWWNDAHGGATNRG